MAVPLTDWNAGGDANSDGRCNSWQAIVDEGYWEGGGDFCVENLNTLNAD